MSASAIAMATLCWLSAGQGASAQRGSYVPPPCTPLTYHSAPRLHAQRVCMNAGVSTGGTLPGTYLFLTPGGKSGAGAGIFKDDGVLVWWQSAISNKESDITLVHYRGYPYLAVWSGSSTFQDPDGMGTVSLYNQHYQRVGRITAGRPFAPDRIDAHEFRITRQGDALFGIYQPVSAEYQGRRVEVYQYVVQKVSLVKGAKGIHTGRVLFQWRSLQHVPLSQSHVPPARHRIWDYFHGNAISQDTDGNLLVSARNTWGIYKINAHTGRIIWQVGANGDPTLGEPWAYQHDVVPLGHDRYSLFDDGARRAGCPTSSEHASRGLIVKVDPSQDPAGLKLIMAYPHSPPICSAYCGSMQLLSDGDVLINWGSVPEISEYRLGGGSPVMDLALSNWSCRGYRFPWRGRPLTRPAVAAQFAGAGTKVWASWNGSTQTAAWRVLAGRDSSHLRAVADPAPKRDFETAIFLHRPYATVAVEALGPHGHVLATSRAIKVTEAAAQDRPTRPTATG